jgi:hypothetical protein
VCTLSKSFNDEGETDKSEKDDIEFVEARKDATKAFQAAKEPFYFIAFLVEFAILFPGIQTV